MADRRPSQAGARVKRFSVVESVRHLIGQYRSFIDSATNSGYELLVGGHNP